MKNSVKVVGFDDVKNIKGGSITIGFVCAVISIGLLSVLVWKFFTSEKGSASFPGGFAFEWGTIVNFILGVFK